MMGGVDTEPIGRRICASTENGLVNAKKVMAFAEKLDLIPPLFIVTVSGRYLV